MWRPPNSRVYTRIWTRRRRLHIPLPVHTLPAGLLHWRVPDANFPGKWYDAFDDVVPARTVKGLERQAFSRRGLIRSMFCSSLVRVP